MPDSTSPPAPKTTGRINIPLITLEITYTGTKLDKLQENYASWARAMKNHLILAGLYDYVFQPPAKPSLDDDPQGYKNWTRNNRLAATVIAAATSDTEQDFIDIEDGAPQIWEALRTRHQNEGPIKQVTLLKKAFSTKVTPTEPLMTTIHTICESVNRAFSVKDTINCDLLKCIAILNALGGDQYMSTQSLISSKLAESSKERPYTSIDICKFLEDRKTLSTNDHRNTTPTPIALAAQTSPPKMRNNNNFNPNTPTCTNCVARNRNGRGHLAKYCIRLGGGMAGKTIGESKAARLADQGKTPGAVNNKKDGLLSINLKDSQGRAMVAYIDPKDLIIKSPPQWVR